MKAHSKSFAIAILLFTLLLCMGIASCGSTNYEEELNGIWELDMEKTWNNINPSVKEEFKVLRENDVKILATVDLKNTKVLFLAYDNNKTKEYRFDLNITNKLNNTINASLLLDDPYKQLRVDVSIEFDGTKSATIKIGDINHFAESHHSRRNEDEAIIIGKNLYFKRVSTDPESYKSFLNQ